LGSVIHYSVTPAEVPGSTVPRRLASSRLRFPCLPVDPGTSAGVTVLGLGRIDIQILPRQGEVSPKATEGEVSSALSH